MCSRTLHNTRNRTNEKTILIKKRDKHVKQPMQSTFQYCMRRFVFFFVLRSNTFLCFVLIEPTCVQVSGCICDKMSTARSNCIRQQTNEQSKYKKIEAKKRNNKKREQEKRYSGIYWLTVNTEIEYTILLRIDCSVCAYIWYARDVHSIWKYTRTTRKKECQQQQQQHLYIYYTVYVIPRA